MSDESAERARLEKQRDELTRRIEKLQADEQHETAASENVGGETDNAHEWENAEIREGQISEALEELRQTEAALARLDEGGYGVCVVCGNPIEPERLALIPEAVRCEKHM
ncbi:MAG: TraR/DksA family transcriptional regulator [Gemmatimonadota bacterium]